MQWYYTKREQRFGPVDDEELHRLAQQGEITPDDLVWNPSFGDKWMPASSVGDLFASPPPLTPPALSAEAVPQSAGAKGGGGHTHNRDLMRMARESLCGHWGLGVGVMLLYTVILLAAEWIPFAGVILSLLLTGPMAVGLVWVFLRLARREPAEIGQLFDGFKRFWIAVGAYLLVTLFTLLWTLLLIIPGIIASYAYAMTYFVLADDQTVGPLQAISRSKEMMRGKKWKLFCLSLRFLGWILLCILTLGIGFLWLGPYMQTAVAHFYDDVRPRK